MTRVSLDYCHYPANAIIRLQSGTSLLRGWTEGGADSLEGAVIPRDESAAVDYRPEYELGDCVAQHPWMRCPISPKACREWRGAKDGWRREDGWWVRMAFVPQASLAAPSNGNGPRHRLRRDIDNGWSFCRHHYNSWKIQRHVGLLATHDDMFTGILVRK